MSGHGFDHIKFPAYEHQEYPKWVNGPGGPVLVNTEDEELEALEAVGESGAEGGDDVDTSDVKPILNPVSIPYGTGAELLQTHGYEAETANPLYNPGQLDLQTGTAPSINEDEKKTDETSDESLEKTPAFRPEDHDKDEVVESAKENEEKTPVPPTQQSADDKAAELPAAKAGKKNKR